MSNKKTATKKLLCPKVGLRPAHQPLQPNTVKDRIFNVLWELKKQGKSKDTIKNIRKLLQVLDKKTATENITLNFLILIQDHTSLHIRFFISALNLRSSNCFSLYVKNKNSCRDSRNIRSF